jgi:hypothetical protein
VLLGTIIVAFLFIVNLGAWLIVADPLPSQLDVICTFAGENLRVVYSKNLMSRYPAAHWILSDYKNGHGRLLQKSHFDMERVTIIDTCDNTLSEIDAFSHWISHNAPRHPILGADSGKRRLQVGLVSSPYHMRRIKLMAERRLNQTKTQFHLLPVPLEKYGWNKVTIRYWWQSNVVSSTFMSELVKIGYFLLTGYL